MPLYEFECPKCHKITETLQRWSDKPPKCEHCGHEETEKKVSIPGVPHPSWGGWKD